MVVYRQECINAELSVCLSVSVCLARRLQGFYTRMQQRRASICMCVCLAVCLTVRSEQQCDCEGCIRECSNAELLSDLSVESCTHKSCPTLPLPVADGEEKRSTGQQIKTILHAFLAIHVPWEFSSLIGNISDSKFSGPQLPGGSLDLDF